MKLDQILSGLAAPSAADRLVAAMALEQALQQASEHALHHALEQTPEQTPEQVPQQAPEQVLRTTADPSPLTPRLLGPLLHALGDAEKGVQVLAARCLELLATRSEVVAEALCDLGLADPEHRRAWGAAILLGRMGRWAPGMGPALRAAMGSDDRDVRWAAADQAAQLARHHPEALAFVIQCLAGGGPVARRMAAYTLGKTGAERSTSSDGGTGAEGTTGAKGRAGTGGRTGTGGSTGAEGKADAQVEVAIEDALSAALADPEPDVRRAALLALRRLPQVSEPVRMRVAGMTQDPNVYVRRTATAILKTWYANA